MKCLVPIESSFDLVRTRAYVPAQANERACVSKVRLALMYCPVSSVQW